METTAHVGPASSPRRPWQVTLSALIVTVTLFAVSSFGGPSVSAGQVPADVAGPPAGAFNATTPARLVDTRTTGRLDAGGVVTVTVAQPGSTVPLAVAITVVAVDPAGPGFLTVWGDGMRPSTSALNVDTAGQTRANFAIVPVGADGTIHVYAFMATDVVVDLTGTFMTVPRSTSGRFLATTPSRLVDTRAYMPSIVTSLRTPFAPGEVRSVDMSANYLQPVDASAYVVSFTGLGHEGWWSMWADGQPWPGTSIVNVAAGGAPATATAIVPVRADGTHRWASITSNAGGDAVIDVVGYITGPSAGSSTAGLFVPVAPTRVADTRTEFGGAGLLAGGSTLEVTGFPFPLGAGVAANVTVTGAAAAGYVTAYPARTELPVVASANQRAGQTVATGMIAGTSTAGMAVFSQVATHAIVDVTGYFTGTPRPTTQTPTNTPASTTTSTTTTTLPPGADTDFHFLYPVFSTYARYDPCSKITVHANYAGAPADARGAVVAVVAQVRAATGLDIVVGDDTTSRSKAVVSTTDHQVIVFWSTPDQQPLFVQSATGGVVGLGGSSYTGGYHPQLVGGSVEIASLPSMTGVPLTSVLLHEFGHVVGLAHADTIREVMYPVSQHYPVYQGGDLNGLHQLGSAMGCMSSGSAATAFGADRGTLDLHTYLAP